MSEHKPTGEVMLEVDHVTLRFGGVTALDDVSFEIHEGEILGLIGPNGAGKTTCFNVTTGVYRPTLGEVRFRGQPLTRMKRFQITRLADFMSVFPDEKTALEAADA